jgi:hypothetical protein
MTDILWVLNHIQLLLCYMAEANTLSWLVDVTGSKSHMTTSFDIRGAGTSAYYHSLSSINRRVSTLG